jgi:hypothetical protein
MFLRNTTIALIMIGSSASVMAQSNVAPQEGTRGPKPSPAIVRLYDSISSSANLPDEVSDAAAMALRIPKPGPFPDKTAQEVRDIRQDPCGDAEVAKLCEFAGAETVRKIRNYSWGRLALKYPDANQLGMADRNTVEGKSSALSVQMVLLDYGIRKNLEKHYGERGASDEQEDRLNGSGPSEMGTYSNAKLGKSVMQSFWGCKIDTQSINYGWPNLFPQHRLTTCHAHFSIRVSLWLFSFEGATGVTNSRFVRKVVAWVPNGASSISAITDIGSNIGNSPFTTTNTNNWMATSGGVRFTAMNPPMTLKGQGTASELGVNFNLTLP